MARSTCLLSCAALTVLACPVRGQATLHTLTDSYGRFGHSVRNAGDVDADGVPDVLVGAVTANDLSCGPGTFGFARIYSGSSGAILHTFTQVGSGSEALGWSVSGIGDLNGDAHADVLVSAPTWSLTSQCGRGHVFLYSGLDGSVLRIFEGTAPAPNGVELFGYSVSSAGDVNADGLPDVIISAPYGLNYNGDSAGYARVYSGLDGSTIHTVFGNTLGEFFGESVAGVGDVNLDGFDDFAVGTRVSTYPGAVGSVRVYSGFDGLLIYFFVGPPGPGLGQCVARAGDVDGDGVPDIAASQSSAVYVYSGANGALIRNLPGVTNGLQRLDGAGDVNQDGFDDLIVSHSTGARIYSGADSTVLYLYTLTGQGSPDRSVAAAGDVNHDGLDDVIVAWPSLGTIQVRLSGCPEPSIYCSAKLNSLGCMPAISHSGVASLSVGLDNFVVRAQNVRNNQPGMVIWGPVSASAPFGGGTRCVGKPFWRTLMQDSGGSSGPIDCSGTYEYHFSRDYLLTRGALPGSVFYAQYWSRDPGYSPPNDVGLTNAVSFTVLP